MKPIYKTWRQNDLVTPRDRRVSFLTIPKIFLLMLAVTVWTSHASMAQEAVPGDACSTANLTRLSGGPETSGKGYIMTCQGGVWVRITESDASGNLGIRKASPKTPLDVGGEIKVGTTTGLACDADREGGIRYNTTTNNLELCDGSSWAAVSVGACGDATPDALSFTDLVNQSLSTLVTSNIDQVTGLSCAVSVAVSGEGSPQFRTCSDAACSTVLIDWTTSGTIDNNSYVQLRLTTSAIGGDTYSATLSVGTYAVVWNATPTGDCTGSPVVGTVCADGTVYAGMSPDGNVKMYVTRCDAGMSWDGSNCSGTRSLKTWNAGNSSGYVTTSLTSSVVGESNTTTLAATDADSVTAGTQDHVAAVYCNDLSQDGNTDWYLPAKDELNVMYAGKTAIGNFDTGGTYYWSSTEFNGSYAWSQRFSDGPQNGSNKNLTYAVRCARR